MQDEQFMRQWNAGHIRFSEGLDHALVTAARRLRRFLGAPGSIGKTYDRNNESPLARKARLTGTAMIGGLTTGAGLSIILFTLAAVASPETSHAVSSVCVASPSFA